MLFDILWLTVVGVLPVIVARRVFTNAPNDRFFVASWALSVLGTLFIMFGVSLGLAVFGLGIFGMFDGIITLPVAIIVSAVVGVAVRRKQHSGVKA